MDSRFPYLEAAAKESNIEALEKHQETASKLIKPLCDYFKANKAHGIDHWHRKLIRLADDEQMKPPETLIMVVGSMGAGKSAAINALIGEPHLLPTSGYDACTSVATEVRWNDSTDPDQAYRADFALITKEELLNELRILREDALSDSEAAAEGSSVSASAADDDDTSHAEIARDKIRAVWPRLTRAELAAPGFDMHALLEDHPFHDCLGETYRVGHPTAEGLRKDLERYVANRDNAALARGSDRVGVEEQLWPLVHKATIFVKAEVLSTGAVIQDMPGGQDGNSARSARAAADGDKCDHLCVFVPIRRAMSEPIVKKPFNNASTFKNWIKFDGRLRDITYVCTMTDDSIEIERDAEEFGLVDYLEKSRQLEARLDTCEAALDEAQVRSQVLEDTVASLTKSAGDKRKRTLMSETVREKRLRGTPLRSSPGGRSSTAKLDPKSNDGRVEVSRADPESGEIEGLHTRIEAMDAEREELQRQLMQHNSFLRRLCIEARNALTRSVISRDFVDAAEELLARPRESMSSVANQKLDGNKIPEPVVHTISAVGYFDSLKRHGRGQFWTSETEGLSGIPAWRDHIKELTVPARRRKCQAFLQAVLTCFYQVDIWCDDSSEISLTPEQEEIQLAIYKRGLDSSIENLGSLFDAFVRKCREIFDQLFSEGMRSGLPHVIRAAVGVANKWPSRKRGDRLLTVSSYRSACRKEGIYNGKGRAHRNPWDLNADLAQPLIDQILSPWHDALIGRLPSMFTKLRVDSVQVLYNLSQDQHTHPDMTESACRTLRLHTMAQGGKVHVAVDKMRESLVDGKNLENMRIQLAHALQREMRQAWGECVEITGQGSFQRQQAVVERHIRDRGVEIYTRALSRIENMLRNKCSNMEQTIQNLKRSVDGDMWHAYKSSIVPREDSNRAMREYLRRFLAEVDGHFQTPS